MRDRSDITIAIVGGNTVADHALSLLLKGAGYQTTILKAPPTDPAKNLLREVDLFLVSPGLREEQREVSLALLRSFGEKLGVPVLTFSSAVEETLFAEDAGSSWPVEKGGLVRKIEAALEGEAEIGPAVIANPVGEAALCHRATL